VADIEMGRQRTDAGALVGTSARSLHAVEAAPQVDNLLFGNAYTRVRNRHLDVVGASI
jgi:hypothetical protein